MVFPRHTVRKASGRTVAEIGSISTILLKSKDRSGVWTPVEPLPGTITLSLSFCSYGFLGLLSRMVEGEWALQPDSLGLHGLG